MERIYDWMDLCTPLSALRIHMWVGGTQAISACCYTNISQFLYHSIYQQAIF